MMAMTLKQQNELTLKRIELQMIEDYFSKEARDNRKQHGQKSSGQMKAVLAKYDFTKYLSLEWNDSKTKEFEEALGKLWSSKAPSLLGVKSSGIFATCIARTIDQPLYEWKIKDYQSKIFGAQEAIVALNEITE